MKKLDQKEIQIGRHHWYQSYEPKGVDQEIVPFLSSEISAYRQNQTGWLEKTRQALFLSAQSVADKLGIERGAYSQYEASEEKGTISLNTLAKAAEAMNCELVYAIRTKNGESFSAVIWEQILVKALKQSWLTNCDQKRRGNALAHVATELMKNPKFRRERGWSKRANSL